MKNSAEENNIATTWLNSNTYYPGYDHIFNEDKEDSEEESTAQVQLSHENWLTESLTTEAC